MWMLAEGRRDALEASPPLPRCAPLSPLQAGRAGRGRAGVSCTWLRDGQRLQSGGAGPWQGLRRGGEWGRSLLLSLLTPLEKRPRPRV